jgi:hypothetical protein
MNPSNKKSMKLVVLLVSSLFIALASAATYSELFMHGAPISIGSAGVYFTNGVNTTSISSAGINAAGTEVTFDNIAALDPGETRTYEQAVNMTNNSGAQKSVDMSFHSLTGQFTANFDYVNVTVIDEGGTALGSIEIVSSGANVTSTGNLAMANTDVWLVRWTIKAKIGATDGQSISLTLKVKVE